MPLETMQPNPAWVADAYGETVKTLEKYSDEVTYKIWGGDWCKDCRAQLPDFGAALAEANISGDRVIEHSVDQEKEGPEVEEYDIEYIPTVVVERDGEDVARFVEDEGRPIAVHLAEQLRQAFGES